MSNEVSMEIKLQLLMGIEGRIEYVRERCKVDQTPEGLVMWPRELEAAIKARTALYAFEVTAPCLIAA